MAGDTIKVGGRKFAPARHVTFGHHIWMMNHVYASGLAEATPDGESFIGRVLASGRVTQLLAGSLDEVGVPWTKKGAEKNAEFFDSLTEPQDIEKLQTALVGVLADFFLSTGGLSRISPNSSNGSRGSESSDGASEAISNSEIGPSSFASLPVTTPAESETS